MKSTLRILALTVTVACCVGKRAKSCNFEDACNVTGKRCSRAHPDTCFFMTPKHLDQGRGTVEFYANISWTDSGYYEKNVTYGVVYAYNRTWGTVGECCNMKQNGSSCDLRPKREKESFFLWAKTKAGKTCLLLIQERRTLRWCESENSTDCIELKNGTMFEKQNTNFISFQALRHQIEMDYFLFRVDRVFANSGTQLPGEPFKRDITGMKFDEINEKVKVGDKELNATVKKEFTGKWTDLVSDLNTTCDIWCFYYRPKNFAPSGEPTCHVPWLQGNYPDNCAHPVASQVTWPIAVGIVVFVIALVLAILIIVGCVKSRIKYCLPDAKEAEKHIPTDTKNILMDNTEEEQFVMTKELPDSIAVCIVSQRDHQPQLVTDVKIDDSKDINSNHGDIWPGAIDEAIRERGASKKPETSRYRLDSGLEVDAHDFSSSDENDDIPDGYSLKDRPERPDSGFETIGSGLSSRRSVGSSFSKHPSESSSSGSWSEEKVTLLSPCSAPLDGIDENPEYAPKLLLPCAHFSNNNHVFHDQPPSDDDDGERQVLFSLDTGIYQPKTAIQSPQKTDRFSLEIMCLKDKRKDKENSSQRDSSSSCDTGCETSSNGDDVDHKISVVSDLLEHHSRLPSYIQESEYLPKGLPGNCGDDLNLFTRVGEYLSK